MYYNANLTISIMQISYDLFQQHITNLIGDTSITQYVEDEVNMITFAVEVENHDENDLIEFLDEELIPYDASWESYTSRHANIPSGFINKRLLPNGRLQRYACDNDSLNGKVPFIDVLAAYEAGHIKEYLNQYLKSKHIITWTEQFEIITAMFKLMETLQKREQTELDALVDSIVTNNALSASGNAQLNTEELAFAEQAATEINNSGPLLQTYFIISHGYIIEPIIVELSAPPKATEPGFTLTDSSNGAVINGHIQKGGSLCLSFDGYGDRYTTSSGHGSPIMIEYYHGELRAVIWSDINKDNPTHTIPLNKAKLELRKK